MIWVVLAFIFSNLFSFVVGYVVLTAVVNTVDNLDKGGKDDKGETD